MTPTAFRQKVYRYYRAHRREFPWRKTRDPYRILISEIMLQQTQAIRVVSYYRLFLQNFPRLRDLARAKPAQVLRLWQGLGYNRRALLLHRLAREVCDKHRGKIPQTMTELVALPGIGPYTAAAVLVFAFDKPHVMIETNIRSVYLHEFFAKRGAISDKQLIPYIEKTLDWRNPREWFYALMDYGAMLKTGYPNPSRRSRHFARQSRFAGSTRQLRGMILRELLKRGQTKRGLQQNISQQSEFSRDQIARASSALLREGFILIRRRRLIISGV